MVGISRSWPAVIALAGCSSEVPTWKDCGQPIETLYTGSRSVAGLAVADDELYVATTDSSQSRIEALPTTCGSAPRALATVAGFYPAGAGLVVSSGTIVFVGNDVTHVNELLSVPTTGGDASVLYVFSGLEPPAFTVIGDVAYVVDDTQVLAVPVTGGAATTVASLAGAIGPTQVVSANGTLYVAAPRWIDSVAPSNGMIQQLAADVPAAGEIVADAAALYLPQDQGFAVVPLDGQPIHTIATPQPPRATAIDADHLYATFTSPAAGLPRENVARLALAGGAPEILVPDLHEGVVIAVGGGSLFAAAPRYSADPGLILKAQLP